MRRKIFSFSLVALFIFLVLGFSVSVNAQTANNSSSSEQTATNKKSDGQTVTNNKSGELSLPNPLGSIETPQQLIGRIINAVMGFVGSIALLMFVYGGLTLMISGGNTEKIKKGRDILVWSAIGLVFIFLSYALVNFIINNIK